MDSLELEKKRLALYEACEEYIAEFHRRLQNGGTLRSSTIPKKLESRIVRIATHITFITNLEDSCPS